MNFILVFMKKWDTAKKIYLIPKKHLSLQMK